MANEMLAETTVAGQEGVVEYLANSAALQQFAQATPDLDSNTLRPSVLYKIRFHLLLPVPKFLPASTQLFSLLSHISLQSRRFCCQVMQAQYLHSRAPGFLFQRLDDSHSFSCPNICSYWLFYHGVIDNLSSSQKQELAGKRRPA